jgi:hypothetical protein
MCNLTGRTCWEPRFKEGPGHEIWMDSPVKGSHVELTPVSSCEIRHWSTSFPGWWGSSSGEKWATAGGRLIRRGARRWNEARIEGSAEWVGCGVLYFIHLIQRITVAMFRALWYAPCYNVTVHKAMCDVHWASRHLHIPEAPGSKFSPETSRCDTFSCGFPQSLRRVRGRIFSPRHFHFTIHQSSYHAALNSLSYWQRL